MVATPNQTASLSVPTALDAFFERHPLSEGAKIVVAFSGWPDSTALLLALFEKFGAPGLLAAHFDHSLRGAESDLDAEFCKNFCAERSIAYAQKKESVADFARTQKIGLEEAGRTLRYRFFETLVPPETPFVVATGHTADDQAETVIFRLSKGTKLRGISGISEVNGVRIRPLLGVRKTVLLDFLASRNVDFRADASNGDLSYERNRIRHCVVPQLESINPDVVATLAGFAEYATELDAHLEAEISKFLRGANAFRRDDFEGLSPFLRRELLSRLYVRANGTGVGLSKGMVAEMERFCLEEAGGKKKSFGQLSLSRTKGSVFFA